MKIGVFKKKMMPLAPTSIAMALPPTSKPKIGFSIDSIVGNRNTKVSNFSPNSESSERPSSPLSDCSYPNQQRSPKLPTSPAEIHRNFRMNEYSALDLHNRLKRSLSPSSKNTEIDCKKTRLPESSPNDLVISKNSPTSLQTRLSPEPIRRNSRSPSPSPQHQKGPAMMYPGLVRPFPVPPHGMNDLKSSMGPYPPEMMQAHHNPFLAAQFQAAAALAHAQVSQFPPGAFPPHSSQFHNPNIPRESYQLYPWLLSRHGRIFPHRFPGSEY